MLLVSFAVNQQVEVCVNCDFSLRNTRFSLLQLALDAIWSCQHVAPPETVLMLPSLMTYWEWERCLSHVSVTQAPSNVGRCNE